MSLLNIPYPEAVWNYFEEICKIPRISRHELKIRKYLIDFASKHNLEHKEDEVGNILIIRQASPGFENKSTIVLQSHMDMVGEKNSDNPHDWYNDPIIPFVSNGWVRTSGTTLGADDGIGIACQMAILTDKSLMAGKIECLFTVDEESGMTGAINLKPDFFEGRTLLNLDSEDEGILYIGCAGGMDTVGKIAYNAIAPESDSCAYEISLTGLRGGHSGDEIHKGFANSIKLMNRLLMKLTDACGISLNRFDGGNLRNAIPREAFAVIILKNDKTSILDNIISDYRRNVQKEYAATDPGFTINLKPVAMPDNAMHENDMQLLFKALDTCPHGVISWSKDLEDLVETSTNLASIKFDNKGTITIVTTQRSSIEEAKNEAASLVSRSLSVANAEVVHSQGYPGWKPNLSSEILNVTKRSYQKLFKKEPDVRAIHAGLECGLLYEKNKDIDMISFGPAIKGAHTPEESLNIESTMRFWDLLTDVIKSAQE
jgi:dipeptidase D